MTLTKWIAQRIIALCTERNISINKLATLSGITQSTLNSILHEESKNPKLATLKRISSALNITLSEFLKDIERADIDDFNL